MGRKWRLAYRKKHQKSQEGCSSTLPVVGNILNIYRYHRFVLFLIVSSLQFMSTRFENLTSTVIFSKWGSTMC